jgi:hypothetical protein
MGDSPPRIAGTTKNTRTRNVTPRPANADSPRHRPNARSASTKARDTTSSPLPRWWSTTPNCSSSTPGTEMTRMSSPSTITGAPGPVGEVHDHRPAGIRTLRQLHGCRPAAVGRLLRDVRRARLGVQSHHRRLELGCRPVTRLSRRCVRPQPEHRPQRQQRQDEHDGACDPAHLPGVAGSVLGVDAAHGGALPFVLVGASSSHGAEGASARPLASLFPSTAKTEGPAKSVPGLQSCCGAEGTPSLVPRSSSNH